MTDPDLNFIAEQLRRVLSEQAIMRADIGGVQKSLTDIADGQTVLGQMMLRLERDMVRLKDLLGRMDARVAHLEER